MRAPRLLRSVLNLARRERFERDLDAELTDALDELAAEKEAAGVPPREARRLAALELGGLDAVKQDVRDARAGVRLDSLLRDASFALRSLRKAPAFAAVAVLTLTLGIGGTAAMLSAALAARSPLPYPGSERLVHLWAVWPGGAGNMAYRDFLAIAEGSRSFESVAAYEAWGGVALTAGDHPVKLATNFVTRDYLALLGVVPALGRLFEPAENGPSEGPAVALVSHAVWQTHFGASPDVVGRRVLLNGSPFTLVGVLPDGFRDLGIAESGPETQVWIPIAHAPRVLSQQPLDSPLQIYWGLARLRPGASLAAARADLKAVAGRLAAQYPVTNKDRTFNAQPLDARMKGALRGPSTLALAGAGLILLLACTNLGLNLLVRVGRRRGEMALRSALGATSARLVQQLLVEAAMLAMVGGALGMALAALLVRPLGGWVRRNVAGIVDMRFDGALVAAVALLAVLATALFGVLPALEGRRVDLRTALARSGPRAGGASARAGSFLVVAQVALGMALLVAASLTVSSFLTLLAGGVGYRTERLLTFRTELTAARYAEKPARVRFTAAAEEALRGVAGLESATILGPSALANATWVVNLAPAERAAGPSGGSILAFRHSVNPGALANLGIPLLEGREIAATDSADAPQVAVISATLARSLWPGASPVGKQMSIVDTTRPPLTVVGVAADSQQRNRYSLDDIAGGFGPAGIGAQRDVYLSYQQFPNTFVTWAVRTQGAPGAAVDSVRRAFARLDPDLPLDDVATLESRLASQETAPGAFAWLFGGFAAFGLLLAALGVFGVVSQVVEMRRKEIGIRIALGALPSRLLARLTASGTSMALAGTVLGAAAAAGLARVLSSLLFGVRASDPRVYAAMAALLLAVTCGAAVVPAIAALRRNPLTVLREE